MGAPIEPKISVVIPCFNAQKTLELQLRALEDQEAAPAFEIVLVDNGSTDGTRDVIRSFKDSTYLPVRHIDALEFQGVSYARNVGILASQAEKIMFCDADDVVSKWWISQGYQCFDFAPVWNGAAILLTDKQFAGTLEDIRSAFGDSPAFEPPIAGKATAFPVLMGGNFGATKAALERVHGFDQSFMGAGEDNDLGFRFRRAGFEYPNAPSVRIGYRGKWDPRFIRRLAFRQAKAHALIATRYEAWTESNFPKFGNELIRVAGSAMLMVAGRKTKDWDGLASRVAALSGLGVGKLTFQIFGKMPPSQVGTGLVRASPERPES
ncbi:glycosyltransferase involved in cell wall biosynthesis [Neomicrococcus aestuarii]|uniref:Glycosyltransferase involved in cell wall biosynthesis n=1 Tax=Neomicrococcus aestuarii TaxID=556325 RepID=A0A7W8WYR3_9MICC|nr:glycosyltransferase family A protein [Neomicrococcus aestuarii]MBB5511462.1 glycosyltransferase involved in cell wall biosynthesis [Neomicrococcus aestuarii]